MMSHLIQIQSHHPQRTGRDFSWRLLCRVVRVAHASCIAQCSHPILGPQSEAQTQEKQEGFEEAPQKEQEIKEGICEGKGEA